MRCYFWSFFLFTFSFIFYILCLFFLPRAAQELGGRCCILDSFSMFLSDTCAFYLSINKRSVVYRNLNQTLVLLFNTVLWTGCWLCVDAELAIGWQCRLRVHGTCGLINPCHHLRKISSWVGNPGRPPYVIPRGSAGLKKQYRDDQMKTGIFASK